MKNIRCMNVLELLKESNNGSLVLPDFQRSFIWEPEDIRELLVSVLGNYFIGSILILNQLSSSSSFALHLIEGVQEVNPTVKIQPIVKIVLDGQQRTTALYYALYQPVIPLKNRKAAYRFYLDLTQVFNNDLDGAVLAISNKDRKALNDIHNDPNIIPFSLLLNIGELAKKFQGNPKFNEIITLANNFMNHSIHTVSLQDVDMEKIVETFERINRTGEPLSVFELLTAKFYKNGIKLREILEKTQKDYAFAKVVAPENILRVIALNRGVEIKRKNILELDSANLVTDWDAACDALESAYVRITDIKNGYGVIDFKKWMPYTTMLIPLSGMLNFIEKNNLKMRENYDKIDRWYWTSVFSNRYDHSADSKSISDFESIKKWMTTTSKLPEIIDKFDPNNVDLDTEKQSSATYKGVINLIVISGALDFTTGQPPQFDKEKIQDDHIFPKSLFDFHAITNRTLIGTNSEKSNKKPSLYFKEKLTEHGKTKLLSILKTHLIDEICLNHLLSDELDNFTKARKDMFIDEIKNKTLGI